MFYLSMISYTEDILVYYYRCISCKYLIKGESDLNLPLTCPRCGIDEVKKNKGAF